MRVENNSTHFRTVIITGLVFFLILTHPLPATAWNIFKSKSKTDWSRVGVISVGTLTEVQLYRDRTPSGSRKIKGNFRSASARAITLLLPDGESRTLQKRNVSKVLAHRPDYSRYRRRQALLAAGITAVGIQTGFLAIGGPSDIIMLVGLIYSGIFSAVSAFIAYRVAPEMYSIYSMPIRKRDAPPPNSSQQSADTADNSLEEKSGPDRLRQQARHSLIRQGLPLDLSSLPGPGGEVFRSAAASDFRRPSFRCPSDPSGSRRGAAR